MSNEKKMCDCNQGRLPCSCKPAEQHQGEPVALPERKRETLNGGAGYRGLGNAEGWNACLDEIAKLGPLYTHPAPAVQKGYNSRASAEHHDGTTLAVLTLGAFDASELGDIDIQVRMDGAEALQQRLVSTEDLHVDLVSAEWARGLEQEVEDCWGTIDKMHMQALGAEDRAKEISDLRSKLAERDALLEDWHTANCTGEVKVSDKAYRIVTRTAAVLSASAEPSAPKCETCSDHGIAGNILNAEPCPDCSYSAPVERDERAEFEADPHFRGMDFTRAPQAPDCYLSPYAGGAWDGWFHGRAALVRARGYDIPDFTPGNGNKAERRATGLVAQLQRDLTERDERIDQLEQALRRSPCVSAGAQMLAFMESRGES